MTIAMTSRRLRTTLATGVAGFALLAAGTGALAQGAAPAAGADTAEDAPVIIVTGTSARRVALDTPLAVTSIGGQSLARLTAAGQADILNTIPTIKADGGGGEVAANVFLRGLPSGGQYQFTPLEYDGIPVLSTFGLNSSAFDVYFRNDLGIDRLEFVRGGVSNLFGTGSVAGLINYISKTGGDELHGTAQIEAAERGRVRGDLAVSGPLGGGFYFAASGYYRYDEGPIRTNLKSDGGQIRANLKYKFPDDSGSVTLYGQYIHDKVQFYLPIPLNGMTRERLPGNDGKIVNSVQNNFGPTLSFIIPGGKTFTSDINDGVRTRGGQIALAFDKQFGDGWGINGRVKYSEYKHLFGLWSDGDGIINVPETLQTYLTNRGLGSLANATYTFVGGGAVPASTLLFANRFTDRVRPMHDTTAELNLTKQFEMGSTTHNLTLGGFYANATAGDFNLTTTYLAEFNNTPRLVNLVVTTTTPGNGEGQTPTTTQTIISRNGLFRAGASYVNRNLKAERYAGYIADQIDAGRFKFDIGFRVEQYNGDYSSENAANFVTDATTPNLSTNLRTVNYGNGTFRTAKVKPSAWAGAVGALYKVSDDVSLYANASRGYFFPELRGISFNALNVAQSFRPEIIKQAQGGIKVSRREFDFTAAAFYTNLDNRRQVVFVNDGAGGFRENVNIVSTESYGIEATLDLRLLRSLWFRGNLTVQHAVYKKFDTTPAFVGNDLERQPEFLYNAGLYYDDGHLDAAFFTNYTADNFTASNNSIKLNGWNVANFDAGYKVAFGSSSLRAGVNVFNVFDTAAVTEGSPRQDNSQTVGGAYFVGRPVLPRRITGRVTFNF